MILQWLSADVEDVVDDVDVINDSSYEAATDSIRQNITNIETVWMIEFVATKSIWTIVVPSSLKPSGSLEPDANFNVCISLFLM